MKGLELFRVNILERGITEACSVYPPFFFSRSCLGTRITAELSPHNLAVRGDHGDPTCHLVDCQSCSTRTRIFNRYNPYPLTVFFSFLCLFPSASQDMLRLARTSAALRPQLFTSFHLAAFCPSKNPAVRSVRVARLLGQSSRGFATHQEKVRWFTRCF